MCKYCEQTDCIISEGFLTSVNKEIFVDLRFDVENNELDINYGFLDENGCQGKDTTWSSSFKINYCPICGEKLREVV